MEKLCKVVSYTSKGNSKLMTPKEFASEYGIGVNKTYELVNMKNFPKVKNGNRILIIRSKVDDWFENNMGIEF